MRFLVEFEVPTLANSFTKYEVVVSSVNRWKAIEKVRKEFSKAKIIRCENERKIT